MADNKVNSKADELYKIYEKFTEIITTQGWKGEFYGWEETVRNNGKKGQWTIFQLDNGFCIGLDEPGENDKEEVALGYWFEDDSDEPVIKVESLEQLLELLN